MLESKIPKLLLASSTLVACSKSKEHLLWVLFVFGVITATKRESNSKGEFCV